MLEDLYKDRLEPLAGNLNRPNWDILIDVNNSGVLFESALDAHKGFVWRIKEDVGGVPAFEMVRDKMQYRRYTNVDRYGLLGLSQINLSDRRVILTEGVSDYFTAKRLCPERNVLGVTTLSGSRVAKAVLVNLFDEFTICADNDAAAVRNTGTANADRFRAFLESYGKRVVVFVPKDGYKDISDNFIGLMRNGRGKEGC